MAGANTWQTRGAAAGYRHAGYRLAPQVGGAYFCVKLVRYTMLLWVGSFLQRAHGYGLPQARPSSFLPTHPQPPRHTAFGVPRFRSGRVGMIYV